METKKISLDLDKAEYKRLKLMAFEKETTLSNLIRKAIAEKYENGN